MHNFNHLVGLILIGTLLGIPFVLQWMSSELEPYPAVIFPGFPGKVTLKESWYETSRLEVGAIDNDTKQYRRLKLSEVIKPIPIEFLESIASNYFGLEPDHGFALTFRYFPSRPWHKFHSLTEADRDYARQWLREHLIAANCDDELLILRRVAMRVNKQTSEV